jgi:hypothetical protein
MSVFAIIFAVSILSLFWGGFVFMLFYSLRLKSKQEKGELENEINEP